jgi:hypothetical protein
LVHPAVLTPDTADITPKLRAFPEIAAQVPQGDRAVGNEDLHPRATRLRRASNPTIPS